MKKVRKSDTEWREQLSPMAYSVAREKATERAFSGNYWDHHGQRGSALECNVRSVIE